MVHTLPDIFSKIVDKTSSMEYINCINCTNLANTVGIINTEVIICSELI